MRQKRVAFAYPNTRWAIASDCGETGCYVIVASLPDMSLPSHLLKGGFKSKEEAIAYADRLSLQYHKESLCT